MLSRLSPAGRPRPSQRGLFCSIAVAAGIQLASLAALAQTTDQTLPCSGVELGPKHTVNAHHRRRDGALDDNSELRLIGALAPRAIDVGANAGAWPMEVAARAELGALSSAGRSRSPCGERAERYGRLQAQAFWQEGGKLRWVQAHMLEQGLARAYALTGTAPVGTSSSPPSGGARSRARVVE